MSTQHKTSRRKSTKNGKSNQKQTAPSNRSLSFPDKTVWAACDSIHLAVEALPEAHVLGNDMAHLLIGSLNAEAAEWAQKVMSEETPQEANDTATESEHLSGHATECLINFRRIARGIAVLDAFLHGWSPVVSAAAVLPEVMALSTFVEEYSQFHNELHESEEMAELLENAERDSPGTKEATTCCTCTWDTNAARVAKLVAAVQALVAAKDMVDAEVVAQRMNLAPDSEEAEAKEASSVFDRAAAHVISSNPHKMH